MPPSSITSLERVDDPDRARDLLAALPGDDPPERAADRLRHPPALANRELERLERPVAPVLDLGAEAEHPAAVVRERACAPAPAAPCRCRRADGDPDRPALAAADQLRQLVEARRQSVPLTATISSPGRRPAAPRGRVGDRHGRRCATPPRGRRPCRRPRSAGSRRRGSSPGPAKITATFLHVFWRQ